MIVFDLDACVWFPEMYMLMGGGGAPGEFDAARNVATDRHGEAVKLLGAIPQIFEALRAEPRFAGCQVAIASRSDEPAWARALLDTFETAPDADGATRKLSSVLAPACVRIHKGSKKTHFAEIREASGVPFDEMVFFDDDPANIRDVAPLGVVCQLTPDGVTAAAWEAALGAYAKARP